MGLAALQGSFRQPGSATIRFERDDTGDFVDWTIAEGDTWDSIEDILTEWNTTIQADPAFGAGFEVYTAHDTDEHRSRCKATTGGNGTYTLTWSQSGSGTALRDFLGSTGDITTAADNAAFQSYAKSTWVAAYGGKVERMDTAQRRGHTLTVAATNYTQGHTVPGGKDSVAVAVTLWTGDGDAATYKGHERWEEFLLELWAAPGGGEPFSVFITSAGDTAASDTKQWVCRFDESPVRLGMRRIANVPAGRGWTLHLRAAAEVTP